MCLLFLESVQNPATCVLQMLMVPRFFSASFPYYILIILQITMRDWVEVSSMACEANVYWKIKSHYNHKSLISIDSYLKLFWVQSSFGWTWKRTFDYLLFTLLNKVHFLFSLATTTLTTKKRTFLATRDDWMQELFFAFENVWFDVTIFFSRFVAIWTECVELAKCIKPIINTV